MKLTAYFLVSLLVFNKIVVANFEQTADTAGFIYEQEQDIYISKIDALQRGFGYNELFDFFSPLGDIVIDTEPVIFNYADKTYLIELWKGQYYASSGAEIGVYEWNGIAWDAVKDEDMLFVSYTLKRDGVTLLERQGISWWMAGFKPGVFSHPEDLALDEVYIEFKDPPMRDAFLGALYELGYDDAEDGINAPSETNTIMFNYTIPKSEQDWSPWMRKFFQLQNLRVVKQFNKRKAELGRTDNSPETIDKVLGASHSQSYLEETCR